MDLQPDQRPALWDDHVSSYETVFEPLINAFAAPANERLAIATNDRVILAIAAVSMLVDTTSRGLRRRLRIDTMPTRLAAVPVEATG
jgi:hypothetical protein